MRRPITTALPASLGLGALLTLVGCSFFDPGPGVGVTFPEGWQVHDVSSTVYEEERRAAYPEIDQWQDCEVATIIVGWDPESETGCAAFGGSDPDAPSGPPFVLWEAAWGVIDRTIEGTHDPDEDGYWDQTLIAEVILPSGRSDSIDGPSESGRLGTQYTVTEGDRTLVLACYARERPPDRWLSIAETLEFLPAND